MSGLTRLGFLASIAGFLASVQPISAELPPVRLAGPLVQPLEWGTRGLTTADVDNDGRNDLIVLNNDQAKIEILYQLSEERPRQRRPESLRRNRWDPELSDLPFERHSIVSGVSMYAVTAADLNGDARTDLIYTSRQEPLVLRFQAEDGTFEEKVIYDDLTASSWSSTLQVADLDQDGAPDLIMLTSDGVAVFEFDGEAALGKPTIYPVTGEDPRGLLLADADADGRDDLFYVLAQEARALRLRLVAEDGSLGPELAFDQEFTNSGIRVTQSGDTLTLTSVNNRTGLVEWHRLTRPADRLDDFEDLQPRVYAAGSDARESSGYAVGDFDGDGQSDVLQADGSGSRVWLYRRGTSGQLAAPVPYPTLAGVSGVTSGRFDPASDRDWVVVFSSEDSVLGFSRYAASGRFDFPTLIALEADELVAVAAGSLVQGEAAELLVLFRRDGDDYLGRLFFDSDLQNFTVRSETELDTGRRQPSDIGLCDLFEDGQPEVWLTVARDPVQILQLDASGDLVPYAEEAPLRKSLLKDLDFASVGFANVDDAPGLEMLLTAPGLVRVLKFTPEGAITLIDQANTRSDEDLISIPIYRDFNADGQPELAVYDRPNGELQLLFQDETGVFRYQRALELGRIAPLQVQYLQQTEELLVLGVERFWSLPLNKGAWGLERLETYETDLEDVTYHGAEVGDLNADGVTDIILVDGENNLIDVLARSGDAAWESALHFTVFERNVHYSGRTGANLEPRELIIADVTGDGLDDVIILVHDRVLLYPQKRS
ncbi:MAG: FG-GAP repeat domain-containing protein [Opitutales bacterium]